MTSRGMSFVYLEATRVWVNLSYVTHVDINSLGQLRLFISNTSIIVSEPDEIEKVRNILTAISQ